MAKNQKIGMAQLNAMSLSELKSLRKKVDSSITKFEAKEKKKALAALKAKAKEMGFSLADLTGENEGKPAGKAAAAKKPRAKVAPKYANPEDKSQTWTGRGRRPIWVQQALEAGKSVDDLLI